MGTRSLTVVKDEQGKEIITMYRQMDGYPSGHGKELAEFLAGFRMVDGYTKNDSKVDVKAANGMGCLAAQIIAHFKPPIGKSYDDTLRNSIGDIYLYPSKTRDCGEEYVYEVSQVKKSSKLHLRVFAGDVTYFGMPGTKQNNMPIIWEGAPEEFDAESAEDTYKKLADGIPNDFLQNAVHARIVKGK